MSAHRTPTRRRWLTSLSAVALVGGIVSLTPSAEAAPSPWTFTTVMTPTAAIAGQASDYEVTVKNTSSTFLTALDHVVLAVPSGFTVTTGTVTAPRGGWTEALNVTGTELTAKTSQGLLYGLRKGETLTFKFSATDTVACDVRTTVWKQKADGVILDPYVPQSPDPTVSVTAVADRFVVTSVTDVDPVALGNQVVKGDPITIGGQFRCGSAEAPTAADGQLSLSLTSQGTPANTGALGGTTSAPVAKGVTAGQIAGATYSAVANAVVLGVGWDGGLGDSVTVNVLGDVASVSGVPGQAIPPSALTVDDAVAGLGAGANGPVALVIQACVDQAGTTCSGGTEISLAGNFKDANNKPLYGYGTAAATGVTPKPTDGLAPASITRVCPQPVCVHLDHVGSNSMSYTFNYFCAKDTCSHGPKDPFGGREVEEDFRSYPTFVSLKKSDGSYTDFVQAPRCVALPTSSKDPNKNTLLTKVGKIATAEAQNRGFCVDVNAITRYVPGASTQTFAGELRIPVLFVEDPRLRP